MAFNKGFSGRNVDSIPGNDGEVLTKVEGQWTSAPSTGGGGGSFSGVTLGSNSNLTGSGTTTSPLRVVENPSVTSVTASAGFSGSQVTVAEVNADYVDYNTAVANPTYQEGRTFYDNGTKDFSYYVSSTDIKVGLGQQLVLRVKNSSGTPIAKGKVVYISSGQGSHPLVSLSDYSTEPTSAKTLGVTMHQLDGNGFGYIILRGILEGVETTGMTVGGGLYLGASGAIIQTPVPSAPNHNVRVGQVITEGNSSTGVIHVAIQNGYELDEIHDVVLTGTSSYDLLALDSDGYWKNTKTLAGNYTFSGINTFNNAVTASNAYFSNNIRVNGTASIAMLETINQTSLQVGEKYIVLMSGSTDHVGLDGSGLLWGSGSVGDPTQGPEGENAYIKYRADNDQLEVFPGLRVSGSLTSSAGISATNFYGDGSGLTNVSAAPDTAQSYTWSAQQNFAAGAYFGTGSIRVPFRTETTSYNIATTDYIVAFSGSALTGTLPSAVTVGSGGTYTVKHLHTSSLYITASAGTIDGNSSGITIFSRYSSYSFVSDGSNWLIF